jgi:hypothetical protein
MNVFPIIEWLRFRRALQFAAQIVCLSRGLLLLIALELITMPLTQNLWTWDKFLHGGQDFELGLLITVTCICLALLCTEQSRCDLELLVAIRAFLLNTRPLKVVLRPRLWSEDRPRIPSDPPTRFCILPLLI